MEHILCVSEDEQKALFEGGWIVRQSQQYVTGPGQAVQGPPSELVSLTVECRTCAGRMSSWNATQVNQEDLVQEHSGYSAMDAGLPCSECCVELVKECQTCIGRAEWCGYGEGLPDDNDRCVNGLVHVGWAYPVGKVLPIRKRTSFTSCSDTTPHICVDWDIVLLADTSRSKDCDMPYITREVSLYGEPEELVGRYGLQLLVSNF